MPLQYAFTITLLPKNYRLKPINQLKNAIFAFNNLFTDADVIWRIDDSIFELTSQGNIHLHGICTRMFTDGDYPAMMAWRDMFRRHDVFGHTVIKPLHDYAGWIEYMYKDDDSPEIEFLNKKIFVKLYKYIPDLVEPVEEAIRQEGQEEENIIPEQPDLIDLE